MSRNNWLGRYNMSRTYIFLITLVFSVVAIGLLIFVGIKKNYNATDHESIRAALPHAMIQAATSSLKTSAIAETPATPTSTLSIFFAGDIMLDRNVYTHAAAAHDWGWPFRLIDDDLKNFDVRVANLEGPITAAPFNLARARAMSFSFQPQFAPELARRFDVVSLANNHTYNQGEAGLAATKNYVTAAGIKFFGDPLNRADSVATIFEKNGFKIGLVGYHAFAGPEEKNIPTIVAALQRLRPLVDFLVVMPHWGVEYAPDPSAAQRAAAHAFIDAGADVVIGAHPHVVEPREEYRGHPIFYSIGNFIFDQYFSAPTMHGEVVVVRLSHTSAPTCETISTVINAQSQVSLVHK